MEQIERLDLTEDIENAATFTEIPFSPNGGEMYCERAEWYVKVPGFDTNSTEYGTRCSGVIGENDDTALNGKFLHPCIDARGLSSVDVAQPNVTVRISEAYVIFRGVAGSRFVTVNWQGRVERDIVVGRDVPAGVWVKLWQSGGMSVDGVDGIAGRTFFKWYRLAVHTPALR